MSHSPAIGIIVPAYNVARFLPATLQSILAQSAADWECIIVDDGSRDETAAVADGFARRDARFRVLRQANAGPCAARNLAFGQLSPSVRLVSFMDSDDVWLPDALQCLRAEIERHPSAVGAHGLADMIDLDGCPLNPGAFAEMGRRRLGFDGKAIVPVNVDQPTTFEMLLHASKVYPPGLILGRREAYARAGPWDARIPIAADWDMVLRMSRFGELRFLNQVILQYRRHPGNISNEHRKTYAEVRFLHFKTFFAAENNEQHKQSVRGGWKAWQRYKIREKLASARVCLRGGKLLQATTMLAHVPAHAFRYARGYPTPAGV